MSNTRTTSIPQLRVFLLALVATNMQGCSNDQGTSSTGFTERDSAGVAIVELRDNPWNAPAWATLDTAGAFRIRPDNSAPATLFGRIRGALKLSDGSVAVLDAVNYEIRIFDKNGQHVRSIGRRGQGPGEFANPFRLLRGRADSLVVFDVSNTSVQIFAADSQGGSSRHVSLPWTVPGKNAQVLGAFADGSYFAITNDFMREPVPGRNPLFASMYAMTAQGDTGIALGKQISTELAFKDIGAGKTEQVEILFWAEPGWTAVSNSYVWCVPEKFQCDVWSNRGGQVRSIRAPVKSQSITDADVADLTSQRLAFARSQADSIRTRTAVNDGYRNPAFPILSLIRSDSRDRIWMRQFVRNFDERTARWLVFDVTGRVYGLIDLPANLQVFDIGADYILGSEADDNDVQVPVIYRYSVLKQTPGG